VGFLSTYWTSIAIAIALLTGLIGQASGLFFSDKPRAKKILFSVSGVLGIMAFAGNVYVQNQSGEAARAKIEKRIAMKGLLSDAISECAAINVETRTRDQNGADAYTVEANKWIAKTSRLIENAYGKGEAKLFENDAGIQILASINDPTRQVYSETVARVQRLNELMERVDTVLMRPDFDPQPISRNEWLCGAQGLMDFDYGAWKRPRASFSAGVGGSLHSARARVQAPAGPRALSRAATCSSVSRAS
jgi:hypothetical protein